MTFKTGPLVKLKAKFEYIIVADSHGKCNGHLFIKNFQIIWGISSTRMIGLQNRVNVKRLKE